MDTRGSKNGRWKGGVIARPDGYIMVRIQGLSKGAKGKEYELLHRLVMEEKLGRKLLRSEIVHHKNHNPADNRPQNLVLVRSQAAHAKMHHKLRQRSKKGQYI